MPTEPQLTAKLQQASELLSSGSKTEAKKLVDEVLQESPHDAEAWFIASLVTDTLEQKFSALGLALQIDPQHIRANEYLAHLKKEIPTDASQKPNNPSVSDMIEKVVGEGSRFINELLGLSQSPQQSPTSDTSSSSTKEINLAQDESENLLVSAAKSVHSLIVQWQNKGKMGRFQGEGKVVTNTIDLRAGVYKINYHFSGNDYINICIVNLKNGEKDHFVHENRSGSKTFHLKETGRFVFEINDYGKNLIWTFEFELLT